MGEKRREREGLGGEKGGRKGRKIMRGKETGTEEEVIRRNKVRRELKEERRCRGSRKIFIIFFNFFLFHHFVHTT